MIEFIPNGVCSTRISFDIKDGKLYSVKFQDGCDGNLKAISSLLEGTDAADAVKRLTGICCGNKKTSCGDQLAQAIEENLK
jgi:uncharacterized protein (TIGR03905 family)